MSCFFRWLPANYIHLTYSGFPLSTPTVTIIVKIRQSALNQTGFRLVLNNFMEICRTYCFFNNNIFYDSRSLLISDYCGNNSFYFLNVTCLVFNILLVFF